MIEALESRISPAGLLTVTFSKGALTIVSTPEAGQDGNEELTFSPGTNPGGLILTPGPATALRVGGVTLAAGTAATFDGVTGAVKVTLGSGADELTFSAETVIPNVLTIDLGEGDNLVDFIASKVGGATTITGKSGADTIGFRNSNEIVFTGNFVANLGDGGNKIETSGGPQVRCAKNFSVTSGAGDDSLLFTSGEGLFAGNVTLSAGSGSDVAGFDTNSFVVITKNAVITSSGATGGAANLFLRSGSDMVVGGALTMSSGAGGGDIVLAAGPARDLQVGGKTTLLHAAGTDADVSITGSRFFFAGPLAVKTAATSSVFTLNSTSTALYGGPITLTGMADVQFIGAASGIATGLLSITGAAQSDLTVNIAPSASFLFAKGMKITASGDVADVANITATRAAFLGPVNIKTGAGNDTFVTDSAIFGGVLNAGLGAGNDTFNIQTTNPGTTTFRGTVVLKGGAGMDAFNFGAGDAARIVRSQGPFTIDGGSETDSRFIGAAVTFDLPLIEKSIP